MDPVIKFQNADILNGEATVIYDLNMEICEGDFVYIVGKVGTGKTSIIRTITAENPLKKGSAVVCGYQINGIGRRHIPFLRRSLGIVFQDFQLLMDRTVNDNLEFVMKSTGWKNHTAINERIENVLKSVGMETKGHKMPHQLSGGEQQRIAIARALLNEPKIIIADEPTGNLDNVTANEIMDLLSQFNRTKGTAVVMVTHNTSLVERYPGRVFACGSERCIEIGDESF